MILKKFECCVCLQTYDLRSDAVECCTKVLVVRECSYCEAVFRSMEDAEKHESECGVTEDDK